MDGKRDGLRPLAELAGALTTVGNARERTGTISFVQDPNEAVALAHWSGQGQAWIRDDDPLRRALHQVTGWRPAK